LKKLIEDVLEVIRSSIPKNIDIFEELEFNLPLISIDPSQIYQVILNLCTNAIQAMPTGGELRIKLEQIKHVDSGTIENIPDEEFICLSVQDGGNGMDAATLDRIYEPFFTTKEKGEQRGTGLGLSIVSSVVRQHGGLLDVESEPGYGTTFRVYIPITEQEETVPIEDVSIPKYADGGEHVLFIDDEELVNEMGATILEELGYRVTSFTDSQEALQAVETTPQDFDLLITDYSMPNLTGPQLMKKVKEIRCDLPMLLVTGYTNLATLENMKLWGCSGVIAKPYRLKELSQAVREALSNARA